MTVSLAPAARRPVLPLLALILVVLTLGGMWLWPAGRPNVILITIDTLRPDRLSAYGYERHRTPNFDRLAAEGALYENAFCDVTWTTPSMASVMTGRYATRHGLKSSFHFLPGHFTTLAELLRRLGYHTAAIVASYPLHSIYGLDQGFEVYDEEFHHAIVTDGTFRGAEKLKADHVDRRNPKELATFLLHLAGTEGYREDPETTERVLRWLHEERREPFFLWVHYFGPHEKQLGGKYLEERAKQIAAYDPDVVKTDHELGRVLDALDELGLTANTAVILDADHGQSIMEHNYFGHGVNIYDPTQRIPLMIRHPGRVPAGVRVERLVRNLDIFPTVLEIVNAPDVAASDGHSLLSALTADAPTNGQVDESYVETYLSATWLFARVVDFDRDVRVPFRRLGWRTSRWKYVVNDPIRAVDPAYKDRPVPEELRKLAWYEELFDLAADPGETRNVINQHQDVAAAMRANVFALQDSGLSAVGHAPLRELDPKARERLRSLGYVE